MLTRDERGWDKQYRDWEKLNISQPTIGYAIVDVLPSPRKDLYYFVRQKERWLIDDLQVTEQQVAFDKIQL